MCFVWLRQQVQHFRTFTPPGSPDRGKCFWLYNFHLHNQLLASCFHFTWHKNKDTLFFNPLLNIKFFSKRSPSGEPASYRKHTLLLFAPVQTFSLSHSTERCCVTMCSNSVMVKAVKSSYTWGLSSVYTQYKSSGSFELMHRNGLWGCRLREDDADWKLVRLFRWGETRALWPQTLLMFGGRTERRTTQRTPHSETRVK